MEVMQETEISCPHCGEAFPLTIDTSQGDHELIEDCTVCCRPIQLRVQARPGEILEVEVGL